MRKVYPCQLEGWKQWQGESQILVYLPPLSCAIKLSIGYSILRVLLFSYPCNSFGHITSLQSSNLYCVILYEFYLSRAGCLIPSRSASQNYLCCELFLFLSL